MVRLPRLLVAAAASGHGKTTVTIGLMAALRAAGLTVSPGKVGPDFIDPGYHELASGRPGRNLDPFLVGEARIVPLLLHGALTGASETAAETVADIAVVEGVMGLYDGRLGHLAGPAGVAGFGSSAHVALLTGSPIVLCVDAQHTSRTVGALVHGLATYEPALRIAGVVLNQVGSARHAAEAISAIEATGVPVLGALPRDPGLVAPSRHLGLVPAAERDESRAQVAVLGALVAEHVDLQRVLDIARSAPDLDATPWDAASEIGEVHGRFDGGVGSVGRVARVGMLGGVTTRPRVAVAGGRAFTFRYAETSELLVAAGCEVVTFDPLTDAALPDGTVGLYLGGGFPQVHAGELAANVGLRESIRTAVRAGLPTVAECAGLLYLCTTLDGTPMAGALPLASSMSPRLTLGYREAIASSDTLLTRSGDHVTGHEFHRTITGPIETSAPDLPPTTPRPVPAWTWAGSDGAPVTEGVGTPTLHASYLHVHWAGHPSAARRFAEAVHAYARHGNEPVERAWQVDLHHHGDRDLRPGLVDFAVNVRPARTPRFLVDAVVADADWSAYPDARGVPEIVAAHHGVTTDHVLLTAGAAEAFTLIARALRTSYPLVVHPQFTEPEAALRAAGHSPERHILRAVDGFRLDPAAVPQRADLVAIGNPTNPTSVLHRREAINALRRPDAHARVLIVDEAFMDAVPGEPESMIVAGGLEGLLVLRSLTKTWGIAGLRAGYVIGDPALIRALAAQQPPWSVSTPALRAMVACLAPEALALAQQESSGIAADRADLVRRLTEVGAAVAGPAAAPFVLVDTSGILPTSPVRALAERGFAVRRGETFPGLGPTWIRVAVRRPEVNAALAAAIADLRDGSGDRPLSCADHTPAARSAASTGSTGTAL